MQQKINKNLVYNNLQINYEEFICKKNNETVLILHGWGGSSQSWLVVGEMLKNVGYNVIIPDLPGFGKTKLPSVFDLDDYSQVIENFVKKLKLNNIILWGHSNGGAIAIKLSNRGKINIKRLVLNNSAGIRNDKKRNFKRRFFGAIAKRLKFLNKILFYKQIRIFFYKIIGGQDYLNSEKIPFLKETYKNIISSDLKTDISNIGLDTLIIWGKNDTYTPISDGKWMRKNIVKSKMIVLENEKHGIHLSSPQKLVETFIKNI